MKNKYSLFVSLLVSFTLNAQIINIPDAVLKDRLVNGYCVDSDDNGSADTNVDTNNDNEVQLSEALAVTNLYLYCFNSSCQFSSMVGLEAFINLEYLELSNHNFTSLDVTALTNLNTFICRSNNSLTNIELGALPNLTSLDCSGSQLSSLDVSSLTNLTSLKCTGTQLTSLDISELSNLESLECQYNDLNSLTIGTLSNLSYLNCSDNLLSAIDISGLTNLTTLSCSNNQLSSLDVSNLSNLTALYCYTNQLDDLNIGTTSNLSTLSCNENQLDAIDLISMPNLTNLVCNNNQITALDFSNSISLEGLDCSYNLLTEIDVSEASNLTSLTCRNNLITDLVTGSASSLTFLNCRNNQISSLNTNGLSNLTTLSCSGNELTELFLGALGNLTNLSCSSNQLNELNLTNPSLSSLFCSNNQLTSLDLSNTLVRNLNCSNNLLTTLNIKNGELNVNGEVLSPYDTYTLNFSDNPNLLYVCADEIIEIGSFPYNELNIAQNLVNQYGYTNCTVDIDCSIIPDEFYTVVGDSFYDNNLDGCTTSDTNFPYLNFSATSSSTEWNYFGNASGAFIIPLIEGQHNISPVFENPTYFTASPSNLTVDFPSDPSPYIQDFCITPNGIFNDLEITIIPLDEARPGFDADYKIVYTNKGTTTLSGSVDLTFQDDLMDLVSASPTEDSQSANMLSWNFIDLTPFESREIYVTMNINSPMETPPVNGDDILSFTTTISSPDTDETPDDNTFQLNQTVVNSFDPNDKTCLEGDVISPEMVGNYVHYRIRFENTGTANAINVVVKDNIDRASYDLSTLVPLDASHDFVARLKDDGSDYYVEFIFENINLPFDDANNDGYVVFKIRTLDTLQLNDTFENEAEIYFDFNFPIITNVAQTTVATLSTEDFSLANSSVVLYPNPTTNVLHLESQQAIKHISIYDISGRQIKEVAVIGLKMNLDISTETLSAGTYFVKIKTETSETIKKIIKE